MSVELVGGALLSALFQALIERLTSREVMEFFRAKKLDDKALRRLKVMLLSANAVIASAEELQTRSPNVKDWLDELNEATHEVEDLLEEIRTEVSSISSPVAVSRSFVALVEPRIEEIAERLSFVLSQKDVLGLRPREERERNRTGWRALPCPLAEECDVYGRGDDKVEIVRLLLSETSSERRIGVVSIVGMGGIGKTTLAQLVYNDDRVRRHFGVKAWVSVSHDFDVLKITTLLLERTVLQASYALEEDCGTGTSSDLHQLQVKLKEVVRGQRFLFVLDDVWNENYDNWDALRSAFESGARGSRILVTTRSEIAASKMSNVPNYHLGTISSEDCWTLFVKHAFDNVDMGAHPDLVKIGKQIVRRCSDLPLAVKSLGGLLRSELNPKKWENVLKSDIWEFSATESNILPALWLSYHFLPSHLKRCFAYCSIFPKDYRIAKRTLVLLWMAEDLLQPQNGKKMEEVGEECFDNLISRSLIQRSSGDGSSFVMHGLVNDLAKFVSGKFCLRLERDRSCGIVSRGIHHFSYKKGNISGVMDVVASAEVKCLRTFLPLGCPEVGETLAWNGSILVGLLDTARYLRVLSLSQYPITELPHSIGELKLLRYLNLSSTRLIEIPKEICTLHNLQTLLLLGCKSLTTLPVYMGSLINLRHLDTRGTQLKEMPAGMCHMKDLQTLTKIVLGKRSASNIKQLRDLKHLRGGFSVSGIENITDARDAVEANLKGKEYLTELILSSIGVADDSQKEKQVLDGLRPHVNLEHLYVHGYGGTMFPDWVGHDSFARMVTISLISCTNCCILPPLGQLPSLKTLHISRFFMVRSVGPEFYSNGSASSRPFRSLEKLVFRQMPEWQEWSFPESTEAIEGGCFPRLTELHLEHCPNLIGGLPERTIQTLTVAHCEKLNSRSFMYVG